MENLKSGKSEMTETKLKN